MIHIRLINKKDVEHIHAVAYHLVAFIEGAPGYTSMSIRDGEFDDEMRALVKLDLQDDWEGGEDE